MLAPGELIHHCLQNPPYTYQWAEKIVPVAEGSSETTTERKITILIHSDACPNACEMWKAIERLKQGESINVQDLETNLYWEFGKFTSRDGESLKSYYSRFYKMMNELILNQCHVTNHQVNVQFLLQLQPEWQRLATTANPLALVAQATTSLPSTKTPPTQNTQYSSTRSQQSTRNRGKAIVKSKSKSKSKSIEDR
ncbi:hypothetical protein Tco_0273731 [Tanacetum coccineum]